MEKNEKDSRKFNDNKTSLQSKRVCEDLERTAIDKKNLKRFIRNQIRSQSNRQLSMTTVTDTKEPDQSNRQLGSATIIDTTIK